MSGWRPAAGRVSSFAASSRLARKSRRIRNALSLASNLVRNEFHWTHFSVPACRRRATCSCKNSRRRSQCSSMRRHARSWLSVVPPWHLSTEYPQVPSHRLDNLSRRHDWCDHPRFGARAFLGLSVSLRAWAALPVALAPRPVFVRPFRKLKCWARGF